MRGRAEKNRVWGTSSHSYPGAVSWGSTPCGGRDGRGRAALDRTGRLPPTGRARPTPDRRAVRRPTATEASETGETGTTDEPTEGVGPRKGALRSPDILVFSKVTLTDDIVERIRNVRACAASSRCRWRK